MNKKLFHIIFDTTNKHKFLTNAGKTVTKYSEPVFYIIYILGGILLLLAGSDLVIRYIVIPFAVLAYNSFIRKILNRPRPFVAEDITPLAEHKPNGSFPSNHAASSMIIAFAWYCVCPYVTVVLVVMAVLTGISRVMVGVHYPADVAVGWLVGVCFGILGFVVG